jgi:hypothetical protein
MTCACEFSGWLRVWLMSFGAGMPWVALAVLLLWWARKALRRECFGSMPLKRALGHNTPAAALFALATAIIIIILLRAMP